MFRYEVGFSGVSDTALTQICQALPGFFAQDDPLADPAVIGAVSRLSILNHKH
jgi:hypothetical protein